MGLVWSPGYMDWDPDAFTYLSLVEAADGQPLEPEVRTAVNTFVEDCKSDGIWNAIKASCILAGARTLDGALVPLVGAAPTNFNFVEGDYNRVTGLVGNASTKYLSSNRNNNADPQNSKHMAFYASTINSPISGVSAYIGMGSSGAGASNIFTQTTSSLFTARIHSSSSSNTGTSIATGFSGANRSDDTNITMRTGGSSSPHSQSSQVPASGTINVFSRGSNLTDARLSFYSIGEALDLALLDTRVSTLMTDLAAAIP